MAQLPWTKGYSKTSRDKRKKQKREEKKEQPERRVGESRLGMDGRISRSCGVERDRHSSLSPSSGFYESNLVSEATKKKKKIDDRGRERERVNAKARL